MTLQRVQPRWRTPPTPNGGIGGARSPLEKSCLAMGPARGGESGIACRPGIGILPPSLAGATIIIRAICNTAWSTAAVSQGERSATRVLRDSRLSSNDAVGVTPRVSFSIHQRAVRAADRLLVTTQLSLDMMSSSRLGEFDTPVLVSAAANR